MPHNRLLDGIDNGETGIFATHSLDFSSAFAKVYKQIMSSGTKIIAASP